MNAWRSIIMAFSMFSSIPMPTIEWKPQNQRYMMAAFPLVGIVIGACLALWCWACFKLGVGPVFTAAGITVLPILLSGGIHMDGFCDVADAQGSNATFERKREILSDSRSGAFAVFSVGIYLISYLGVATELPLGMRSVALLALIPVYSRVMSGIATLVLPKSTDDGMLSSFSFSAKTRITVAVLLGWAFVCMAAALAASAPCGFAVVATGLIGFAAFWRFAREQFGGISGDLAGAFLQVLELAMLLVLVLTLKLVGL
ncbi:cobalamin synthase [Slackia heliotrinireducens]|uniref:Adenosylcobinamide-GDP ribazoletransferase n=1 Tax=Slackia heliotrinireducens (strain ATCC 29202 / DSM 20476 / NCTC 11029 / RHS 1) TaxID=471855 RepID=C7N886_SLAHD|nr:adenosylcobinamide-GDP ribazoletransferase [Slackia heliotrinireducens]ACV23121.1 cobalamin-5-phosphate synthase [Slackia heliotrinireducens DSM 20476]VEH02136.1 cobalamin synthase [Slackia heliotrinireducens]